MPLCTDPNGVCQRTLCALRLQLRYSSKHYFLFLLEELYAGILKLLQALLFRSNPTSNDQARLTKV